MLALLFWLPVVGLPISLHLSPAPQPYPEAQVIDYGTHLDAAGDWYHVRAYTVSRPLELVLSYYEDEMEEYCESGGLFGNAPVYNNDRLTCREATCTIHNDKLNWQQFYVRLCPVSNTETRVVHEDFWQ